jgi:hypothetical protein
MGDTLIRLWYSPEERVAVAVEGEPNAAAALCVVFCEGMTRRPECRMVNNHRANKMIQHVRMMCRPKRRDCK